MVTLAIINLMPVQLCRRQAPEPFPVPKEEVPPRRQQNSCAFIPCSFALNSQKTRYPPACQMVPQKKPNWLTSFPSRPTNILQFLATNASLTCIPTKKRGSLPHQTGGKQVFPHKEWISQARKRGSSFPPPSYNIHSWEDLLENPAVPGLGFVHFAVAKASPEGQAVAAGRRTKAVGERSNQRTNPFVLAFF